jgi:hypothetical protein
LGESHQLVATWCPGALEARRKWCVKRWNETLRGAGKFVVDRVRPGAKVTRRAALSKQMEPTWLVAYLAEHPSNTVDDFKRLDRSSR